MTLHVCEKKIMLVRNKVQVMMFIFMEPHNIMIYFYQYIQYEEKDYKRALCYV